MQNSWNRSLSLLLSQRIADLERLPRIAIIGIGNPLRSDDAAGLRVARALREFALETGDVLIIEAGHAPENRTAELREFAPDIVLFIDAAAMGERPGTIRLISEEDIDGMSASTHSLPLSMLARYLTLELNCQALLLGIQAGSNEIGETVHANVLEAVDEVVRGLKETLSGQIRI